VRREPYIRIGRPLEKRNKGVGVHLSGQEQRRNPTIISPQIHQVDPNDNVDDGILNSQQTERLFKKLAQNFPLTGTESTKAYTDPPDTHTGRYHPGIGHQKNKLMTGVDVPKINGDFD
jgi:hypothetical protein